jgi:BA14K-like protein
MTNIKWIGATALCLALAASPALARGGMGGGGSSGGGGGGGGGMHAGGGGFHGGSGGGFRAAAMSGGSGFRNAQASASAPRVGNTFAGRSGGQFAGGDYRGGYHRGLGFAGGLAIGGALGYGYDGYYGDDYYADNVYNDGDQSYVVSSGPTSDSGYCAQRYKSYDPASGTYLGYDGLRHPCE